MPRFAKAACAALLAGALAHPAAAKAPCYTQAEAEAEQAIRLHTELMVVGLTCAEMSPAVGPSLFAQYKQFTLRHQDDIAAWEKALIGHFRRHAKGNATRNFDSFRTRLANEMSQRAIALTTPVFCQTHVPAVTKVGALSSDELKHLVRSDQTNGLTAAPRCEPPATRVAQPRTSGDRTSGDGKSGGGNAADTATARAR